MAITRKHVSEDGTRSKAIYSDCEEYRFVLSRDWNHPSQRRVAFIGLNPSTATELQNDPTVARCVNYAKIWEYDGMVMLNAFGFRSTDPKKLKEIHDPVGTQNDKYILQQVKTCDDVVLCWGTHAALLDRHQQLLAQLASFRRALKCLKITKDGYPSHPLYLKKSLLPVSFYSR